MKIIALILLVSMVGSYVWSMKNNAVEKPPDPPMTWRRALIYTFIGIYVLSSIVLAIGVLAHD